MLEGEKIIDKMLADSKYCLTLLLSSHKFGAVAPDNEGVFLCLPNKEPHSLPGYRKVPEAPNKDLTQGQAAPFIVRRNLMSKCMSKTCSPSASSPQPIQAQSIIDKLLLTDNLDDLRHRLSRDFMQLITGEPDDLERERMFSDFNTLDMILETIEKERK